MPFNHFKEIFFFYYYYLGNYSGAEHVLSAYTFDILVTRTYTLHL